jgi:hypothetical protein
MSLDPVAISPESRRSEAARPPFHRIGIAGLLLAVSAVILEVLAIAIGSGGAWGAATVIAWFVIGFQAVSLVLGLVAIVSRRGHGRRLGLAAVLLSLLANPLLLVGAFSLLRGIA